MKLICCDCVKEYEVNINPPVNFTAIATVQPIGRNLFGRIRCPHCGLEHFLLIIKYRE